jgi:hypothetical protein
MLEWQRLTTLTFVRQLKDTNLLFGSLIHLDSTESSLLKLLLPKLKLKLRSLNLKSKKTQVILICQIHRLSQRIVKEAKKKILYKIADFLVTYCNDK